MAFQKVKSQVSDKPTVYLTGPKGISGAESYKDLNPGYSLEGVFKNTYINQDGEYGPSSTHYIEMEDQIVGINGCTSLNQQMLSVKPGTLVQIVYEGLGKKAKGKKAPYLFSVLEEVSEEADSKVLED